MAITHTRVALTPDDGVSEVGSDEWNAIHTVDVGGIPGLYKTGAGATISDSDYASTPANGTMAVAHDSSTGRDYLWIRSNGAWKSVEAS